MNSLKEYKNLKYLSRRLCYKMFALFLVGLVLMILSFGLGFVPGFSFDVSMVLLLLSFGFALLFFLLWIIFSIRGKIAVGLLIFMKAGRYIRLQTRYNN